MLFVLFFCSNGGEGVWPGMLMKRRRKMRRMRLTQLSSRGQQYAFRPPGGATGRGEGCCSAGRQPPPSRGAGGSAVTEEREPHAWCRPPGVATGNARATAGYGTPCCSFRLPVGDFWHGRGKLTPPFGIQAHFCLQPL